MNTLPTAPGLYWWRKTATEEWRRVEVVDFGEGHLVTYDRQHQSWSGMSIKSWSEWTETFPIGEWHPVATPEQVAELNQRLIDRTQGMLSRISQQGQELRRLKRALKKAYVHNQNMHCFTTKGRLHEQLNLQTSVLRNTIRPVNSPNPSPSSPDPVSSAPP